MSFIFILCLYKNFSDNLKSTCVCSKLLKLLLYYNYYIIINYY